VPSGNTSRQSSIRRVRGGFGAEIASFGANRRSRQQSAAFWRENSMMKPTISYNEMMNSSCQNDEFVMFINFERLSSSAAFTIRNAVINVSVIAASMCSW
jgi:hypothetical protein